MMKKNSKSIRRHSGAYTSPGTPEYEDELPKPWSSERVPLPSSSRSHVSAAALMPFNSGRALPSKWDDAERWITSPISTYGPIRNSVPQPQRRPKSKSGPLGPPGLVYLSNYSPNAEGGKARNFMANSPLNTGVLVTDGLSINYDAVIASKPNLNGESNITRSTSVPGLSDLVSDISMPSSREDKLNGVKEEEVPESWDVNRRRRDMATQMSPDGSTHSSSKGRLSFSNLPSSTPNSLRQNNNRAGKDDVRDVQVDKGTPVAKQYKKQGLKRTKETISNTEDAPLPWNATEASENTSNLQAQEEKITNWENLQKAKAEAAIRKLEMKLEKKRSTSMDKIASKLRASQMKAQAMRNMLQENQARPARTTGLSGCIYVKPYLQSNCLVCRKKQE
ncbi:hypothetical protein ACS0TY_006139 [Phlomoides rotata]